MRDVYLADGSAAVVVSAGSPEQLAADAAGWAAYLDTHPDVTPAAVAALAFRAKVIEPHRAIVRGRSATQLGEAMRAIAAGGVHPDAARIAGPALPRRIAFVFPGQGSQQAGMGRDFYDRSADYRDAADEINAEFEATVEISPLDYLLDDTHAEDVRILQPAIFLHTLALARMWQAVGIQPAAVIGHSQGEIAAVVVSGHLGLRDGIRIVADRARVVYRSAYEDGHDTCAMAVVGADRATVEAKLARLTGWAELAVVNSATVHAISGDERAIDTMVAAFAADGVFARRIGVDHPGHTSFVRLYEKEFNGTHAEIEATGFAAGDIPCFGGTLGAEITSDLPVGDYWFWNLRNRVRFDLAITAAADAGINTFVEMSEHPTMLLSITETLGIAGVSAVVVGTGKKKSDPLDAFAANHSQVLVGDAGFAGPAVIAPAGAVLPDFLRDRARAVR
ncbi:acyltransferase domain-containing protein [Gordonia sp. ABSL1-1]|uniref:acyltransferase domain-containing protein n=1 Tax=Gordonia sp. ABSL1-1 TaxID=3053923 RepID=UPI0025740A7C|nr:acyltransferase domain-containing protein [Gordonia sp. ABSL1-1]MDL9937477.1 acyltransferase domain-containing protein [Gordonia sp. ABSL1-1]